MRRSDIKRLGMYAAGEDGATKVPVRVIRTDVIWQADLSAGLASNWRPYEPAVRRGGAMYGTGQYGQRAGLLVVTGRVDSGRNATMTQDELVTALWELDSPTADGEEFSPEDLEAWDKEVLRPMGLRAIPSNSTQWVDTWNNYQEQERNRQQIVARRVAERQAENTAARERWEAVAEALRSRGLGEAAWDTTRRVSIVHKDGQRSVDDDAVATLTLTITELEKLLGL